MIKYLAERKTKKILFCNIVYKDQIISFDITSVLENKTDIGNIYTLLNAYLEYRSLNDKEFSVNLYNILNETLSKLSGFIPSNTVDKITKESIMEIIDIIDYDKIVTWLSQYQGFLVPTSILEVFDSSKIKNGGGSREQTYIVNDYIHLSTLAIISRAISPIVGHYFFIKGYDLDKNMRCFYLYTLIQEHPIFESEAINKLIIYIEKNYDTTYLTGTKSTITVSKEKNMVHFTEEGYSPEDLIFWILSSIIFLELLNGDIFSPINREANLVTKLYGFVRRQLGSDRNFSPKIEDKYIGSAGLNDDDKTSVLEQYNQIITSIQPGKKEELNWYYWDVENIRKLYYPYVDKLLLEKYLEESDIDYYKKISQVHLILLSIVLKDAFDIRLSMYLSKEIIVRLFALIRAILYTKNHKYLALLMASISRNISGYTGIESASNIDKETSKLLEYYYPYTYTERQRGEETKIYPIYTTIHSFWECLIEDRYEIFADKDTIIETLDEYTTILPILHDVKILFANLLINIAQEETRNENK